MPPITFPSKWLKAEVNVNHGDYIKFLDKGKFDEKAEQWVFTVGVIPQETPGLVKDKKLFGLNKKNFEAIRKVYGADSDGWLNKEMQVDVRIVENPKTGEDVAAVRLKAPGSLADGRAEDEEYHGELD